MKKKDYNRTDWSIYFKLDSESPSGLSRIKEHWGHKVGAVVGSKLYNTNKCPHGWEVSLHSVPYYVHRIIWVMTYGHIESNQVIDHLDGNPFNTTISNLALKTQQENNQNRLKQSNNTSGFTGISKFDSGSGHMYYRARWHDCRGNAKSKAFPIKFFGEEVAKKNGYRVQERTAYSI